MTDSSIVLTDPAREIAELCAILQMQSGDAGETFLAEKFGVVPWSREFYQIIFTIIERCSLLQRIVEDLDIDNDYRSEIIHYIFQIMDAFSANSMKNPWGQYGSARVGAVNVGPIKAISGLVRQKVAYRKLQVEELGEIQEEIITLINWLREHQLYEQDFIRQALIDGLEHFRFRMDKLAWLGWGYTLESLREVIAAYMLLERSEVNSKSNPDEAALLLKVSTVIKSVYSKVTAAKDLAETGDWLLKAYVAGSLVYQGKPLIAGLLASPVAG